jgi:hypothetical protein
MSLYKSSFTGYGYPYKSRLTGYGYPYKSRFTGYGYPYKSSIKGYGCPYTNPDLRVTEIPINPEAEPRLVKPDRSAFPCQGPGLNKPDRSPDFKQGPGLDKPDRLPDFELPEAVLCNTAGQNMPDNSDLPSLPCLRLHELVAPTLVTHS